MSRSVNHLVRAGLRAQVVNGFLLENVIGLDTLPTFTQRHTSRLTEPYILFNSVQSLRVDTSKFITARDYVTMVEIKTADVTGRGGPYTRDQLADEVVRILERTPPVIPGFNVYIQTVESIDSFEFEIESKTYFKTNITVMTRVIEDVVAGTDPGMMPNTRPEQSAMFAALGFAFPPTQNRIELGDSGTITPQAVYPSNNNGFNFIDSMYTLATGSDGVLDAGVITVDADDVVSVDSVLNYENQIDSTITEALTATTAFPRIRSLRSGGFYGDSIDVNDFAFAQADDNVIHYGTIAPSGFRVAIPLLAGPTHLLPGQRAYIAYDASQPDLLSIIQDGFNNNIIDQFTLTESNGFKVYILNNPFPFANTLIINLS